VPDVPDETRRFVVGLGNPGRSYERTRHNVGFRVLAVLRRRWGVEGDRKAFGGQMSEARPTRGGAGERRVRLLEPHTYMNRSGLAVREMAAFYKADVEEILVVLDDMNLPVGRLRARSGGSAGGQKGLADVMARLGTDRVPRLRIGIGQPPAFMDGVDYVLSRFTPDEEEIVAEAVETAADAVEDWVFCGLSFVMDKYNRKAES
jgi:PTH1 family peptidyl-tRNA hydrolase